MRTFAQQHATQIMRSTRRAYGEMGKPSPLEAAAQKVAANPIRLLARVGRFEINQAYGKVCLFDKALATYPRRAFTYFDTLYDALEEAKKRV